jgi:hypothetical protein
MRVAISVHDLLHAAAAAPALRLPQERPLRRVPRGRACDPHRPAADVPLGRVHAQAGVAATEGPTPAEALGSCSHRSWCCGQPIGRRSRPVWSRRRTGITARDGRISEVGYRPAGLHGHGERGKLRVRSVPQRPRGSSDAAGCDVREAGTRSRRARSCRCGTAANARLLRPPAGGRSRRPGRSPSSRLGSRLWKICVRS